MYLLDFSIELFSRRAVAQKFLDDVFIRFFILKIISQILADLCWCVIGELIFPRLALVPIGIPSLDPALIVHGMENASADRIASTNLVVRPSLCCCYC